MSVELNSIPVLVCPANCAGVCRCVCVYGVESAELWFLPCESCDVFVHHVFQEFPFR